jgi:hypothetical protein
MLQCLKKRTPQYKRRFLLKIEQKMAFILRGPSLHLKSRTSFVSGRISFVSGKTNFVSGKTNFVSGKTNFVLLFTRLHVENALYYLHSPRLHVENALCLILPLAFLYQILIYEKRHHQQLGQSATT